MTYMYIPLCLLLHLGSSPADAVSPRALQVLVGGHVLESESRWISCTYNWSTPSQAHVASQQWRHIIPGLSDQIHKRQQGIARSAVTQSVVFDRLKKLLAPAACTLDELNVNWYLSHGSAIGFLRHQSFIPWDQDVDIDVKMNDRWRICDFIMQGKGAEIKKGKGKTSAFRLVPGQPQILMVGYIHKDVCVKVLWVDIETEVALDLCLDCHDHIADSNVFVPTRRALFGNVEVNVPQHPWDSGVFSGHRDHGVDKVLKQVSMKTHGGGWSCTAYKCAAVPKPMISTPMASFDDLYHMQPSAMHGPFDFHIDASTNAQCSLPRDFSSCSAESDGLEQVWVRSCESSPWSLSVLIQRNLVKRQGLGHGAVPTQLTSLRRTIQIESE